VHRNSRMKKSSEMQQYADIYLLLNYCICFGRPSRPSSGVHKTVIAASGTDHTIWGASMHKRDEIRTFWSRWKKLAPQIVWSVPRKRLQFYVLLMMGVMDARNMQSNLTVNKCLHTAASCWMSPTRRMFCFNGVTDEIISLCIIVLISFLANRKTKDSVPNVGKHSMSSVCTQFLQERNFDLLGLFPNILTLS